MKLQQGHQRDLIQPDPVSLLEENRTHRESPGERAKGEGHEWTQGWASEGIKSAHT